MARPRTGSASPARRPRSRPSAGDGAAERGRILQRMERAWRGPAWHGPAVLESLADLTAPMAAARPIARAHSIGELVLHMAAWKRAVARRISGRRCDPTEAENFPRFAGTGHAWRQALATLEAEHAALRRAVTRLRPARLERPGAGGTATCSVQIHGVIEHDLWHAGQIMMLRRALEGRRARG